MLTFVRSDPGAVQDTSFPAEPSSRHVMSSRVIHPVVGMPARSEALLSSGSLVYTEQPQTKGSAVRRSSGRS